MIPVIDINVSKSDPARIVTLWGLAWCLFEYPASVDKDNVLFKQVLDLDKGFHIRALFKKPVTMPGLPEYRMCPNFPTVYISKTGEIADGDLLTQFTTRSGIHYVMVEVPCQYHKQPVSVFRLYADAWGPQSADLYHRHIPIPRNGNWQDYRPGNVKWAPRTYNQFMFDRTVYKFDPIRNETFRSGDYLSITEFLNEIPITNESDGIGHDVAISVGGPGGWIARQEYGNSVDMCYAPFWCAVIYNARTRDYIPAWSLSEVLSHCRESNIKVTRNGIRRAISGIHNTTL